MTLKIKDPTNHILLTYQPKLYPKINIRINLKVILNFRTSSLCNKERLKQVSPLISLLRTTKIQSLKSVQKDVEENSSYRLFKNMLRFVKKSFKIKGNRSKSMLSTMRLKSQHRKTEQLRKSQPNLNRVKFQNGRNKAKC